MIIRNLAAARNSERRVVTKGWESVRLLLRDDRMGFSFHITTIYAGAELAMHYTNHLESVYCISGRGSIENCASGEVHRINPGDLYALDRNDKHILRGETEMVMACVFNPPLTGQEVHDETGAYPAAEQSV